MKRELSCYSGRVEKMKKEERKCRRTWAAHEARRSRTSGEWQYKKDKTQKPRWLEPKWNHNTEKSPKSCVAVTSTTAGPTQSPPDLVQGCIGIHLWRTWELHPSILSVLLLAPCPMWDTKCVPGKAFPEPGLAPILSWMPPAHGTRASLSYLPLTRGADPWHQNANIKMTPIHLVWQVSPIPTAFQTFQCQERGNLDFKACFPPGDVTE